MAAAGPAFLQKSCCDRFPPTAAQSQQQSRCQAAHTAPGSAACSLLCVLKLNAWCGVKRAKMAGAPICAAACLLGGSDMGANAGLHMRMCGDYLSERECGVAGVNVGFCGGGALMSEKQHVNPPFREAPNIHSVSWYHRHSASDVDCCSVHVSRQLQSLHLVVKNPPNPARLCRGAERPPLGTQPPLGVSTTLSRCPAAPFASVPP
jgi:hypothetical protein